jgi:hypothetical protein
MNIKLPSGMDWLFSKLQCIYSTKLEIHGDDRSSVLGIRMTERLARLARKVGRNTLEYQRSEAREHATPAAIQCGSLKPVFT